MENYGFITMENYGGFLLVAIFFGTMIGWFALNKWNSCVEAKIDKEMEELARVPFGYYLAALEETRLPDTLGIVELKDAVEKAGLKWEKGAISKEQLSELMKRTEYYRRLK